MNEHDRKSLKAIKKHIYSIQSYCKKCNGLDEFTSDPMLVEACVFNIMQIGEISKSELSEECKERITSIPWKQIYRYGSRLWSAAIFCNIAAIAMIPLPINDCK